MKREFQKLSRAAISVEAKFVAISLIALMGRKGEIQVSPGIRGTIFPAGDVDRDRFGALVREAESAGVIVVASEAGKYFIRRPGVKIAKKKAKAIDASAVVMTFPVQGSETEWALHESDVATWTRLFPGLDINQEMRGALAHVMAGNLKTARGMRTYLVAWLNRSVKFAKTGLGSHGAIKVPEGKSRGRLSGILEGIAD